MNVEPATKKAKANATEQLSFRIDADGGNNFLVLYRLPSQFVGRYGRICKRLLIRKCYEGLYEIVLQEIVSGHINGSAMLFTGVPGIGKSMFMIYFICRLSRDYRMQETSFALEIFRGVYCGFTLVSDGAECVLDCSRMDSLHPLLSETLILSDLMLSEPPGRFGKFLLIFSSPNPLRYKEVMKAPTHFTFCLPTWSEAELLLVDSARHNWYPRFVLAGGVPRLVLWNKLGDDPMITLDRALASYGELVANCFSGLDLVASILRIAITYCILVRVYWKKWQTMAQCCIHGIILHVSTHLHRIMYSKSYRNSTQWI